MVEVGKVFVDELCLCCYSKCTDGTADSSVNTRKGAFPGGGRGMPLSVGTDQFWPSLLTEERLAARACTQSASFCFMVELFLPVNFCAELERASAVTGKFAGWLSSISEAVGYQRSQDCFAQLRQIALKCLISKFLFVDLWDQRSCYTFST